MVSPFRFAHLERNVKYRNELTRSNFFPQFKNRCAGNFAPENVHNKAIVYSALQAISHFETKKYLGTN